MEFLKHIDWRVDNGVFLPMLNDFRRNQFYDRILANTVKDHHCVDIGFGTGLLSMLALKHGARHITAYEVDDNRYQLGQHVINELGLNNQIELHNKEFSHNMYQFDKIYLTETVSSSLWAENLFSFMPRQPGISFLANECFLELWVQTIPEMYAERLFKPVEQHSSFAPGVDINSKFVDLINQLMQCTRTDVSTRPDFEVPAHDQFMCNTVWGPWSFLNSAKLDATCVASYSIDINSNKIFINDSRGNTEQDINFSNNKIDLRIELSDTPGLIVPRAGIRHNNEKLILDTAESWGPAHGPAIAWKPGVVNASHNLRSGIITYSLGT